MASPPASSPAPLAPHSAFTPAERRLLWLVAFGFFMQTLDSTIVNTALPAIATSMGESPMHMQMAVVAYGLAMAVVIPASGWLADRFGTRRIFLLATVLFVAGSAACAASQSLGQLVGSRVLQGLGGALLLPVGRLAVLRTFERSKFLEAMAFVAIPGLMGQLMGPTLGGLLVEHLSWHWIFLINVPVGLVGLFFTQRWMPALAQSKVAPFDTLGFAMLTGAMLCLSLSVDGLGGLGLRHAVVLVLLLAGLALLAAYWLHALKVPQPLFPPRLFHIHTYRVGILGNLFARIGIGAMPFMIPMLMQLHMGYSPAQAGMLMLPVALASMGTKRLVTRVIRRYGYRRVLLVNTLLLGLQIALFATMTIDQPLWLRMLQMALFGACNSMQFSSMNTITLQDLDARNASSGNSLMSMVQMLSMSLGVTVAAAMVAMFENIFTPSSAEATLLAFRCALVSLGIITACSAWIFWQLRADAPPSAAATAQP